MTVALRLALPLLLILAAAHPHAAASGDPTAPGWRSGSSNPSSGAWQLHSTLIGPERRSAIINGQSVAVGDRIAGARVARIDADEVHLDTPERRVVLRLLPNPSRIHARE